MILKYYFDWYKLLQDDLNMDCKESDYIECCESICFRDHVVYCRDTCFENLDNKYFTCCGTCFVDHVKDYIKCCESTCFKNHIEDYAACCESTCFKDYCCEI